MLQRDCAVKLFGDLRGGRADQQGGVRFGGERRAQDRVVQAFILAAQDHPETAGEGVQGFEGGVHAGGFRIVIEVDAVQMAHKLEAVLDRFEGAHGGGDGCRAARPARRAAAAAAMVSSILWRPRMGISRGVHQQFAVEPDFPIGQPDARRHRARAAEPERRSGGERSVAHAGGIVGVENGERACPLRFKQASLGGGVVGEGVMAVQMVLGDVQRDGDIGVKFGDGFELEAG